MTHPEDETRKPTITIIAAIPEHAEGIRFVQRQTWLTTYPNSEYGITREDIQAKIDEMQGQTGLERLRHRIREDTRSRTLVAKDGDRIIGFIGVQKLDDENKIRALYVLEEYQGRGIGRQLLQQGLDWLGTGKKTSLEVVSYNTKAIQFYRSFGFMEQGGTTNDAARLPSGKELPETLMVRG